MTNSVENLQNSVSDVQIQLAELKDNVELSAKEKKEKADSLKSTADNLLHQIDSALEALRSSTDADAQEKIEKLETSKEVLQQISDLYTSILASLETEEKEEKEEKGFWDSVKEKFGNAKDWVGTQWNDVRDKDKRKNDTGKNLLRTTGFVATGVGIGALIYSGCKRLFSKEAREERRKNRKERREARRKAREERRKEIAKLPFWERPIGKVIKWTGIGTGIYYLIHYLRTGKGGLDQLLDWDQNSPVASAEDVYDDYSEFAEKNPEKYKKYENIGESVNTMYDSIWETERKYFGDNSQIVMGEIGNRVEEEKLQKKEKFEHLEAKGLIPYSFDNFYKDVDQMMSFGGVSKYIRAKNVQEYLEIIKQHGADWFDRAMVPFLSTFTSFATFGIVKSDTAEQKMDKFFKGISENAEQHKEELDLFFRQYMKILTYIADKKNALALKHARKIISVQGYEGKSFPSDPEDQEEMLNEAINDSEWVENNLKTTSYGSFLSSNILGAYKILDDEGLSDTSLTNELQDIVKNNDNKTEKIIGGFDDNAFKKAELKFNSGGQLNDDEKEGLRKISQNVINDMKKETGTSWCYDTFDYVFELLGTLTDISEGDKQLLLKESGLSKCFVDIVNAIQNLQNDINVNPTKENVELLKTMVGQYTSMKKELAVALYAIKEAKENIDAGDYIGIFFNLIGGFFSHFVSSMKDLFGGRADIGDFINIFAGLTVSGGILKIGGRAFNCKSAYLIGHGVKKIGVLPVTLTEMGLGHTRWGWAVKRRIDNLAKVDVVAAENLMKKKILDGVLSRNQVVKIVQGNDSLRSALRLTGFQNNDKIFAEIVRNMFGEAKKVEADLFVKYYGKVNNLVGYSKESLVDGGTFRHKFTINISEDGFDALKSFDIEFSKLGENTIQKSYFEYMLKKVGGSDDMRTLKELIENEEFRGIISKSNVKELKKIKIDEFRKLKAQGILDDFIHGRITIDDMLKKIPSLNKLDDIIETPARIAFNKSIDNAIRKLNEVANPRAVEVHINKLKSLKNDVSLLDDEMESFTKFINHGFDASLLPDFKKLFALSDELKNGEKLGAKLKKLLMDGNYSEFKGLLKNKSYGKYFKDIPVDNIVKNFDSVVGKIGKLTSNVARASIKGFMKILSKIL